MVCPSPDDLKMRLPVATTLEAGMKKLILSLEYEDIDLRASAFDDLAEVCAAGETPFGHPIFRKLSEEVKAARIAGNEKELYEKYETDIRDSAKN